MKSIAAGEFKDVCLKTLDDVAIATLVPFVTRPILVESGALPQPFPRDPADQIIVATARLERAVLVTKDRKARDYTHVRTVW